MTIKEKIVEVIRNHPQGIHSGDLQRMSFDIFNCEPETCARRCRELREALVIENFKKEGTKGVFWRIKEYKPPPVLPKYRVETIRPLTLFK